MISDSQNQGSRAGVVWNSFWFAAVAVSYLTNVTVTIGAEVSLQGKAENKGVQTSDAASKLLAFPGAVGQGAAARGGRGGDVYHVTTLKDFSPKKHESVIEGSLRDAIKSAHGPRTIVFDVAGPIALAAPLEIKTDGLTLAGQTSPGGVTLWGYPLNVYRASDVVIRFIRVRTGDFNARPVTNRKVTTTVAAGRGNKDLDASTANAIDIGSGSQRVILDHVSASWGMDEACSVTKARDVTIQHSIIAESLNDSYHAKGPHGYGSLIRGELTAEDQQRAQGGYTLYGNLWAHHQQRSPSIGGQQRLIGPQTENQRRRADVNIVNNVVYDWGQRPSHRNEFGEIRINFVGNYHVNGPSNAGPYVFHEGNPAKTSLFQRGNYLDADQDAVHNGKPIDTPERVQKAFAKFDRDDTLLGPDTGEPFNFFASVAKAVLPADEAYRRVVDSAGASLWRDSVDRRVIKALVERSGGPVNSQERFRDVAGKMPGIDDLPIARRPSDFDTDGDGMPNDFETSHSLNPNDRADGNGTNLSHVGYTNLEVYLDSLVAQNMPGSSGEK